MREYLPILLTFLVSISGHPHDHKIHLIPAHIFCRDVVGERDILLPSPQDCSVYYRCENGSAVPNNCQVGLEWCQVLQQCTLPLLANCTIGNTVVTLSPEDLSSYNSSETTSEQPPGPSTSDKTCLDNKKTYPDPEDCRRYQICHKGKPHSKKCPGKKVYSAWIGACVDKELASCINGGKQEGLFCPVEGEKNVDPSDCGKYYECKDNSVVVKSCPGNTQYNEFFQDCYSSDLAHCQVYSTVSPSTEPTEVTGTLKPNTCPIPGAVLPNPLNCSTYYTCSGDSIVLEACPDGLAYSCWVQQCVPPSDADCTPSDKDIGKKCNNKNQRLPNSEDCGSYYECKDHKIKKRNCKKDLEYNAWLKRCVKSEESQCNVQTTLPTTSPKPVTTPPPSEHENLCPIDGATLPDPLDCNAYYVCEKEQPVHQNCPEGDGYSCWDQKCLPAQAANCISKEDQTGKHCKDNNSTLPNIDDCGKYYECENGKAVGKSCEDGLEFNQWYGKCVQPSLSHCKVSPTTTETTASSGSNPTTTSEPTSELTPGPSPSDKTCLNNKKTYPDPEDCRRYQICHKGKPHSKKCPGKKVYSAWIGACVDKELASCINGGKQEGLFCPVEGEKNVDPSDCGKYYECKDNSVVVKSCPGNTQYNEFFQDCYSSDLAHCQVYSTVSPSTEPTEVTGTLKPNTCPIPGAVLPNPLNCSTYYTCSGDSIVLEACPDGLAYSCWVQQCVPPSDADCTPSDKDIGKKCNNKNQRLPNSEDCGSYYECKDHKIKKRNCKKDLEYNAWLKRCVKSEESQCNVQTTLPPTSPKPVTTPPPSEHENLCPIDGATLPDPLDCNAYYVCEKEQPVHQNCPEGDGYSCWDQKCLPAQAANCISKEDQTGKHCKDNNSTLPNIDDCGKYYECENGKAVGKSCEDGLEFNQWYGKCVQPSLSHCKVSPTTTETTASIGSNPTTGTVTTSGATNHTKPKPPSILCPIGGIIYPSMYGDCQGYMECDKNRQLLQVKCDPPTFNYNCEKKKCENITHCCATGSPTAGQPTEPTEPAHGTGSHGTGPSEPTEPSHETGPSEPTEPSHGTGPSEPTEPSHGTGSHGTGPSEPTEPSHGTGPSEPTEPSHGTGSHGTGPSEPTEPSHGTGPSEPTEPSHGTGPYEPTEPSHGTGPSEPTEPSHGTGSHGTGPSEPTEASHGTGPSEPTEPSHGTGSHGTGPSEPTEPSHGTGPSEPTEPSHGTGSHGTGPSEPTEPSHGTGSHGTGPSEPTEPSHGTGSHGTGPSEPTEPSHGTGSHGTGPSEPTEPSHGTGPSEPTEPSHGTGSHGTGPSEPTEPSHGTGSHGTGPSEPTEPSHGTGSHGTGPSEPTEPSHGTGSHGTGPSEPTEPSHGTGPSEPTEPSHGTGSHGTGPSEPTEASHGTGPSEPTEPSHGTGSHGTGPSEPTEPSHGTGPSEPTEPSHGTGSHGTGPSEPTEPSHGTGSHGTGPSEPTEPSHGTGPSEPTEPSHGTGSHGTGPSEPTEPSHGTGSHGTGPSEPTEPSHGTGSHGTGPSEPTEPSHGTGSHGTGPSEPTEPSHGTGPYEPTEPSHGTGPSEPTEPSHGTGSHGTGPSEPTEASHGTGPSEPTEPSHGTGSHGTGPSEPTEPSHGTGPSEPTEPSHGTGSHGTGPSEPTEPSHVTGSHGTGPSEPTEPSHGTGSHGTGPSEPTEPSKETGPSEPTEPSHGTGSHGTGPSEPTEPSHGTGPSEPTEPSHGTGSQGTGPSEPTEPSHGTGSHETGPSKPTEPSHGTGPSEPTEPSHGTGSQGTGPSEPTEPSHGTGSHETGPSEPTEPSHGIGSHGTGPSEPTEPSKGTGPSEPTEPSKGTGPSEPTEPTHVTNPSEPTEPSHGTGPSEPTEPSHETGSHGTGPSKPTEPSHGTGSHGTAPSKPTEPSHGTGPSEPTEPSHGTSSHETGPSEPTEPSHGTGPSEPTEPSHGTGPSEPTEPSHGTGSHGTGPSESTEPSHGTGPSEPTEPSHGTGSHGTGPSEPTEPSHGTGSHGTGPYEPTEPSHGTGSHGTGPSEPTEPSHGTGSHETGPSEPTEPSSPTTVGKPNLLCPIGGIIYPSMYGDCQGYMECDKNRQLLQVKCDPPTFNYNCEKKKCENITHCCATGSPTPGQPTEPHSHQTHPHTNSTKETETPTESSKHTTTTQNSTNENDSTDHTTEPTSTVFPPSGTCPFNGAKLPNPLDCNGYFECINQDIVSKKCPVGEIYSCWDQKCTAPQDGQCITDGNPKGQNCSTNGEVLPDITNCHVYYECVNGVVEAKGCARDSIYNEWLETCVDVSIDIEKHACVTYPTVTPTVPTKPTKKPVPGPNDLCPLENARLPNPVDCSTYYTCINETLVLESCLGGLIYSCWDQQCENVSEAVCITDGSQNNQNCSVDGLKNKDVTNCHNYYECVNGTIILKHCPTGLEFNDRFQECASPTNSHCKEFTTSSASVTPPIPSKPGSTDTCPVDGALLPNPLNCSSYYKCINGEPVLQLCAEGLEYSCWDQQCETPGSGKCISDGNTVGNTCKFNGQKSQNPKDCHSYYVCKKGKVVEKKCSSDLYYNKWFGMCVPRAIAFCKETSTDAPPVTTVSTPKPGLQDNCPLDGAILPNPLDCTSYYKCENNEPVSQKCPNGEAYSCWDQKCEDSAKAECINDGDQLGLNCSREGLRLPDLQDCVGYYECVNNKVQKKFCFNGFNYNRWYGKCTLSKFSHCKEYPTHTTAPPTTLSTIKTPSPTYDLCPLENAVLPNPVDCTSFYRCINETLVIEKCPPGQLYSCWDQKCEDDKDANCIKVGSQEGIKCSVEGLSLPNLVNCSNYYECVNGSTVVKSCPPGLEFNDRFQNCYKPDESYCKTYSTIKPTPPGTSPTIQTTPSPTEDVCPLEGVLLPNPVNCSTYYKCINGSPIIQTCGDGLEYSCWDQRCEPAGEAQCIAVSPPPGQHCNVNGQQNPDPSDCHKYQECVDHQISIKTCPFNGYYNKWFGCVPLKSLSHCEDGTTIGSPTPTKPTPKPSSPSSCPTNGAVLPDPLDCSKYYKCEKNEAKSQKCPKGKKYSCWDQKCKKDSDAQCINVGSPLGQTCSRGGVRLQNLESCTSYYECVDGIVQEQYCFIGFKYNRWSQECELDPFSYCKTYPTVAPSTVPTTTTVELVTTVKYSNSTCSAPDTQVADTSDCQKYFYCDDGTPVQYNCAPGYKYDCWKQSCVQAKEARCVDDPKSFKGKNKKCSTEGQTVPDLTDCRKYYECKKNKIKKEKCNLFEQYSIWSKKCVMFGFAKCANGKLFGII